MHDNYFSICFILIIFSLTIIEKKRLNTILTPFTVCTWPFLVIVALNNFLLRYLDFYPVSNRVQMFLLCNFITIWIVGFFTFYKYKDNISYKRPDLFHAFSDLAKYQPVIITISLITIIITIIKVSNLISSMGGIYSFTSQEFEDEMVSGIGAHFIEVGKICFILLVFTYKSSHKKIYSLLTLIGLFLAIAIIQVKYHAVWVLLITFFFLNFNHKIKRQLKNVIIIGVILIVIMNLFWIFLLSIWGSIGTESGTEYLRKHTFIYFVSGPIILNYWLDFASIKPDWTILSVFLNFKNVILGNPTRINPVPLTSIGFLEAAPGHISNIGTSFGVYYLIGGFLFTIFTTLILSFLNYIFYFKSMYTNNKLYIFLNLLFLTITSLNSFGQYFTALSLYETIILFAIFLFIFSLLNKSYELIKLHSFSVLKLRRQ